MVVVFDLDDTLFKERDFVLSAFAFISEKLNNTKAFDVMFSAFLSGKDAFGACNSFLDKDIPKTLYLEWYRSHIPTLSLSSDVILVLDVLSRQGIQLGILTDGRVKTQRSKIEALGLSKWIEKSNIVISEAFGSEKPSLENYRYFMHRFNEPASNFFYVGDNLIKDFIAPNELGWHTICILDDGRNIHKQSFDVDFAYLPQYRIHSLIECLDIIPCDY